MVRKTACCIRLDDIHVPVVLVYKFQSYNFEGNK